MQEEVDRRREQISKDVNALFTKLRAEGKSMVEIDAAAEPIRRRLYEGIPDGVYYYGVRVSVSHPTATRQQLEAWIKPEVEQNIKDMESGQSVKFVRMTPVPGTDSFDIVYKSKKPVVTRQQEMLGSYIQGIDEDGNRPIDGEVVTIEYERELKPDEIPEIKEKKGVAEIAVAKNLPTGMFSKEVGKYLGGKRRKTKTKKVKKTKKTKSKTLKRR